MSEINESNVNEQSKEEDVVQPINKEITVPEYISKDIKEKQGKEQALLEELSKACYKSALLSYRENQIVKELDECKNSIESKIRKFYKKLKLDKETDYTWQYSIDGKFIGTPKEVK